MYDSGCFVEYIRDDVFNGLFLFLVDILWGYFFVIEFLENLFVLKFLNGDEIRDKSMLFYKQFFFNFMFNSYMEKKVDEFYK